ncbi:MAG: acyl carrier protein [Candidatus Omnitrophica bacterium]|nr:acyl carrier protein [Candidatus Omnitrophota bacterium]MBU1997777.1 acyl carrier protein [Candidatus Omnitrophota bacterium]MBU4334150.1 acyl carrier protein [Candidatus Omnitrophota bacterium]
MNIEKNVKLIIAEQLRVKLDEVIWDASLIDDFGCDSLDSVELVMALEEEFLIELSNKELKKIVSVGDAIKYIENKLSNKRE